MAISEIPNQPLRDIGNLQQSCEAGKGDRRISSGKTASQLLRDLEEQKEKTRSVEAAKVVVEQQLAILQRELQEMHEERTDAATDATAVPGACGVWMEDWAIMLIIWL